MDGKPLLTIITVTYNAEVSIEQTILSIINQTFTDIEYLIIDGASTDRTIDIINNYKDKIDLFISEPDLGIYDAMNKGIDLANGEWILFMNSGDRLVNDRVISETFSQSIPEITEIIYSDWFLCDLSNDKDKLYPSEANYDEGNLLHQSIIYKKKLHQQFGKYIVTPKLIISDYIFFNTIPKQKYFKSQIPISINDKNGVSSQYWSYEQKVAIDFIFNRIKFPQMLYKYIRYFLHRIRKWRLSW